MSYLGEVKTHSRALFSAMLGLAFGISINHYTSSLFGAHLIKEFGWARSDFAFIGTFAIAMLIMLPITGRITDVIGVRKAAAIGIFGTPLTYLALANMGGDIRIFFAITFAQIMVGCFTTATVFNRVVAERFVTARGLAFAIIMTGPPLVGAIAAPVFGTFIDAEGWRAGYLLMGGIAFAFGLIALLLLPPHVTATSRPSTIREDFALVSRNKVFWLLFAGMFLVNLPQAVGSSQLMIMLAENGVSLSDAWFLSVYPVGVVLGRFIFGVALDRFAPHIVAAIGLSIPAIGFAILASPMDTAPLVAIAVLSMGLAQGAEGDVAAFLIGRHFPLAIFASVAGLIGASTAFGASVGAAVLQSMLASWDNFFPFMVFSAVVTLAGALIFLPIGAGKRPGHDMTPDSELTQ
jgi:MFS family permease